jgi:hypothetical protein
MTAEAHNQQLTGKIDIEFNGKHYPTLDDIFREEEEMRDMILKTYKGKMLALFTDFELEEELKSRGAL